MNTKITQLGKPAMRDIRLALQVELDRLGPKLGLSLRAGSGSFTPANGSMKIEISVVGEGGVVASKEAESFKALATCYGLQPEDLGRSFISRGQSYTIIGLYPRSSVRPLIAQREDGKRFKFPIDANLMVALGHSGRGEEVPAKVRASLFCGDALPRSG